MMQKIHSFNYAFFFVLACLSLFYFLFKESIGDSYALITISNVETGFFHYLMSSVLFFVGYYVGPWIALAFIVSSFTVVFAPSKISKIKATCFFYSTLISFMFFSNIFFKKLVGDGLISYLNLFGKFGSFCLFLFFVSASLYLVLGFSNDQWIDLFTQAGNHIKKLFNKPTYNNVIAEDNNSRENPVESRPEYDSTEFDKEIFDTNEQVIPVLIEYKHIDDSRVREVRNEKISNNIEYSTSDFLKSIVSKEKKYFDNNLDQKYFSEISSLIEDKLSEFNITGKIINVLKGPVVDTFELELGAGVKVSKINSIVEDLGLALSGAPIRLVYPLKGRTTLGIEVPRNPRAIIYLDEVLEYKEYMGSAMRLPVAMGRDAFGEPFVVDLAAMPHMLVAGATGAGKSVFINTLLVSLLIKLSPEKLKLILIDPKQLELALYANLPHLILPVITESKMASASLLWAVQEMERRYSILKEFAVRNIDGFNKKLKFATSSEIEKIQHFYGEEKELELPYIVIIVDEFADLILSKSGKEIETNICRLAAKARAAGIHLVIATQRPSVDVITGLIKSNFPTRVSFRVTTNIDSRTILSAMGAEKLLGMGDMLYKNGIDMSRLHSAYISEEEIEKLMSKLSKLPRSFDSAALDFVENGGEDTGELATLMGLPNEGNTTDDLLYKDAVKIVAENRVASASMLQRRLRIGYNRAANLVEEMERNGVVGPQQGSKPRKVLISSDEAQIIS